MEHIITYKTYIEFYSATFLKHLYNLINIYIYKLCFTGRLDVHMVVTTVAHNTHILYSSHSRTGSVFRCVITGICNSVIIYAVTYILYKFPRTVYHRIFRRQLHHVGLVAWHPCLPSFSQSATSSVLSHVLSPFCVTHCLTSCCLLYLNLPVGHFFLSQMS